MGILRISPPIRSLLSHQSHQITLHRTLTTTLSTTSLTNTSPSSSSSLDITTPSLSLPSLNTYTFSPNPSPASLKQASTFFTRHAPTLLYTAAHLRSFPAASTIPEVAFLGRSNVGKSSLLNALFSRPNARVAHVSKRPGRTRTMNGFGIGAAMAQGKTAAGQSGRGVDGGSGGDGNGRTGKEAYNEAAWKRFGRGGLVVVDMPGYGAGSREEWGREVMKVLTRRRQLRRTFLLVDAEHGCKGSDLEVWGWLRREGVAVQVVLSKVDKIVYPGPKRPGREGLERRLEELGRRREVVRGALNEVLGRGRDEVGDMLCCSAEKSLDEKEGKRIGIDELRWSVMSACGLTGGLDMEVAVQDSAYQLMAAG